MAQSQELVILHFNDVYHISNTNLIARFATVLSNPDYIAEDSPSSSGLDNNNILRIFSGDAFSPSLEAAVLRGGHMAPVLDGLGVDAACYGNHDFDFGEVRLIELARQTRFPWLLANAVSGKDGNRRLLAGDREYLVKEVAGYRIGFFGLAGTDWPSNCQHLPECTILDPSTVAKKVASHLRLSEGCDLVIAITHMRLVDDLAVANATLSGAARVDILLGGHDHHVVRRAVGDNNPDPNTLQSGCDDVANISNFRGDVRVVKSGSDWRGLSILRLQVGKNDQINAFISNISLQQIIDLEKLPNYNTIPPSPQVLNALHTIHDRIENNVQRPLLHTAVPLEGRSRLVRGEETNLGNMLADATCAFYNCDIALINSGGIRCDRVIESTTNGTAPLCIRDVIEICPFDNAFVVKRVSGHVLVEALENSVSNAYSDGRFLQLSVGLCVTIDWTRPEGERVCSVLVSRAQDDTPQQLDREQIYIVAMAAFIGSGFDGYSCFQNTETLIDAEGAVTDTNLLLEMFKTARADADHSELDIADDHTSGIRRARRAVIRRFHTDGLPVVAPVVERRMVAV